MDPEKKQKNLEVIEGLLKAGAESVPGDEGEYSALFEAIFSGRIDVVSLILRYWPDAVDQG